MNRRERKAARVKGPKGEWLEPQLLQVLEKDEFGRPTSTRLCYDDEILGDILGGNRNPLFFLIWVPERSWPKPN